MFVLFVVTIEAMAKGDSKAARPEPAADGDSKNHLRWLTIGSILLGIGVGFLGDGLLKVLAPRASVALVFCIVGVVAAISAIVFVLATREEQPLGHTLPIKLGALVSVCVSGGIICAHLLREHGIGPELSSDFASNETSVVGVLSFLPSIFVAIVVSRLFPSVLDERPRVSRLWLAIGFGDWVWRCGLCSCASVRLAKTRAADRNRYACAEADDPATDRSGSTATPSICL